MPAIEGKSVIEQALSATTSTIAEINGESQEKVPNEFLIDPSDSSEQISFSSASADKVVEDDGGMSFRLPKYFQALLTLFACFTLLLCTLTIIRQIRKLCQSSSCTKKIPLNRVDSDKEKGLTPLMVQDNDHRQPENDVSTVAQLPQMSKSDRKHFDYYHTSSEPVPPPPSPSHAKRQDSKENDKELHDALKLKRVRFVRRVSGPFSEENIDFVGQTYKKKCKEVVQTEHLGQVPGKIKQQQSVRKSKAVANANAQNPISQPPSISKPTQH